MRWDATESWWALPGRSCISPVSGWASPSPRPACTSNPTPPRATTAPIASFYRRDSATEGIVGLPVLGFDRQGASNAASVLYLHNESLRLRGIGRLDSRAGPAQEDGCKASCVDWYGNARPVFLGERIFGLLGYELVGRRLHDGKVLELRRIDFAPRGTR